MSLLDLHNASLPPAAKRRKLPWRRDEPSDIRADFAAASCPQISSAQQSCEASGSARDHVSNFLATATAAELELCAAFSDDEDNISLRSLVRPQVSALPRTLIQTPAPSA